MRKLDPSPMQKYLIEVSQPAYLQHPFTQALQLARENSIALNKGGISISEHEGQLMRTFLRPLRLGSFVEVGTLTGFSSLWILESLAAQGVLWTFELEPKHFAEAKKTFARAGQLVVDNGDQVEYLIDRKRLIMVLGDARKKLQELQLPVEGIFIDADKAAYNDYLSWGEKQIPKGGVIIADNIFLFGGVYGEGDRGPNQVKAMQDLNLRLMDPERYLGQVIPTNEGMIFATKLF